MHSLQDPFGRRFSYLRLSIIDACNFSCSYCLPNSYKRVPDKNSYLSASEIQNLVACFAKMGTYKIRLTGGEPTLRKDFLKIVRIIQGISGIKQIALSTNAYRLKELAPELKAAGVNALNVSVDSLDPEVFFSNHKVSSAQKYFRRHRTRA